MAKSLNEARREAAARTAESIAGCETDGLFSEDDDELHPWQKVADGRALRGVPAVSKHSAGSAIQGTEPGTDEHLERLS